MNDTDMELQMEESGGIADMDCFGSKFSGTAREDGKDSRIMCMDEIQRELDDVMRKKESLKFNELPLSAPTMAALRSMGLQEKQLTKFQEAILPHLLEGKDVTVAAGMCLKNNFSFLLPAVEFLYHNQFTPEKGIGAIFICPTPRMAAWLYLRARDLLRFHSLTLGLVCGYTSHSKEEEILKGVNLLIAIPCCLRKHLQNTAGVKYGNLKYLMIDQVDLMLKLNCEEEMRKVMSILPETRQTIIFSVTETIKEEDLARLSLQKIGVYIEVDHGQKRNVVAASENEERRVREKCSSAEEKGKDLEKKGMYSEGSTFMGGEL